MMSPDEIDFQSALRTAGLELSAVDYTTMLAEYRRFRTYLEVLNVALAHESEPAATFMLQEIGS